MPNLTWEIVSKLGVPIVLAVCLSIGIFLAALWLVKNLLKQYEKERETSQKFLSEAVNQNTQAIKQMADRLNENMGLYYKFIDGITGYINRMETADRYQREEHIQLLKSSETVNLKLQNIAEGIRNLGG